MSSDPIGSRFMGKLSPVLAIICGFLALLIYLFFLRAVFSVVLFVIAAGVFGLLWAISRRASINRSLRKLIAVGVVSFVVSTLVTFCVAAALFMLAFEHRATIDLTASRSFTLSPFSMREIEAIGEPVEIIGFVKSDDPLITDARDLLEQYDDASDLIETRIIDPDLSRAEASRYGWDVAGKVLVVSGEKKEWSASWREQSITGLIVRVTSSRRPRVYFLSGHGERQILEGASDGMAQAAQYLRLDSFDVEPLDFLSEPRVPTGASVVIVAAPRVAFLPNEVAALNDYLMGGGDLLVMLEPEGPDTLPNLLKEVGLEVISGEVYDPARNVFKDPRTPAVARDGQVPHPLSAGLPTVFFPSAAPIKPLKDRSLDIDLSGILASSPASYAIEKDGSVGAEPVLGPFYLAASVEVPAVFFATPPGERDARSGDDEKGGSPNLLSHPGLLEQARRLRRASGEKMVRILAVADSDFATDRFIDELGNEQLFVSSIKWLSESEDITAIPKRSRHPDQLVLTSLDLNVIKFVSIVLFPMLPLIVGGVVWWRRR